MQKLNNPQLEQEVTNLTHIKELFLEPWIELVGKLQSLSENDTDIFLEIGDKILSYKKDSTEATYLQQKLTEDFIGRTIAVLRTDILEKPIVVRLID